MTLQDVKEFLIEQGLKEYPSPEYRHATWMMAGPSGATRLCECNDKPAQLVVYGYDPIGNIGKGSIEMDVTGEHRGVWYKLSSYTIPVNEVFDCFNRVKSNLANAWDNLQ